MASMPDGAPASFYAFPAAYNRRRSSVVVSGTSVRRPYGMLRVPSSGEFEFVPSRRMDYELELGFFVSKPVDYGKVIKGADEAKEHIFGFVLLNDWSARDVQFTEMIPLGPVNGKASATTISPWVVTLDALKGMEEVIGDEMARERMAKLPPHLRHDSAEQTWSINVEVALKRKGYKIPVTLAQSDLKTFVLVTGADFGSPGVVGMWIADWRSAGDWNNFFSSEGVIAVFLLELLARGEWSRNEAFSDVEWG